MASERPELSYHGRRALEKLQRGTTLCARTDASPEGIEKGGLLFWIEPGGKGVGPSGARELIAKGYVTPLRDGLLDDASQSWRPA